MPNFDLVLRNCNLINENSISEVDIAIKDKRIEKISSAISEKANKEIDVKNSLNVRYEFMKQTNLLSSVTADIFRCKSDT